MMQTIERIYRYLFDPARGSRDHFLARWLFLRALGLIYFSAFYALLFQVRGLIGPRGILPASRIPPGRKSVGCFAVLVRAYAALVLGERLYVDGGVLDGSDRVSGSGRQHLAAHDAAGSASVVSSRLLARRRTSPATSRTACCWRRDFFRCFLRRRVFYPGLEESSRRCGRPCSCCCGSGSGSTLSRGS